MTVHHYPHIAHTLLTQEHINCSGQGEVKLRYYSDTFNCGNGDACDFYFKKVVIKERDGEVFLNIAETEDTEDRYEEVWISNLEQLDQATTVNFRTDKDILISFQVWDEDGDDDTYIRSWSLKVPFFKRISGESDNSWFEATYRKKNDDGTSVVNLKYRILSCDNLFTGSGCSSCSVDNYYGTECKEYCRAEAGYYTCGSSGERVCEEKRRGDDCDTCITGFTGESCQSCSDNYYPEKTCDVLCPPYPDKYNCSERGEKECLGNWTGINCTACANNYYGLDCSTFCNETANYTCDELGKKVCKENYHPKQKCDTNCEPLPGSYTCNQTTGNKICEERRAGGDCDKCIEYYYGEGCKVYCKPDIEYHNCSENGMKLCLDSTAIGKNNCRKPDQNLPLIGAMGGGGGLLLVMLAIVIIFRVRKERNKKVAEEIGGEPDNNEMNQYHEATYPTANEQAAQSSDNTEENTELEGLYNWINREEIGIRKQQIQPQIQPDQNQDDLYSTLQFQPVYATIDKQDRHGEQSSEPYNSPKAGEEPTYADVRFVGNRRGDDVVTYRNTAPGGDNGKTGQDEEETTYITVTQLVEDRL